MNLYSYIVARDYGFAPNPFFGFCTLATCKPQIRKHANVGDWVVGTGSSKYNLGGHLIYAMQVSEILSYDAYWEDPRFLRKRPNVSGSLKLMYGDNIYHRNGETWLQEDSHHSFENGEINKSNLEHDTDTDRVLVATKFVYFGKEAPRIPKPPNSAGRAEKNICHKGRGHLRRDEVVATSFAEWLEKQNKWGYQADPLEFDRHKRQYLDELGAKR